MITIVKKDQIVRKLQRKDAENTAKIKKNEAQTAYLAMMTDTNLEEGENEND